MDNLLKKTLQIIPPPLQEEKNQDKLCNGFENAMPFPISQGFRSKKIKKGFLVMLQSFDKSL